VIVEPFSPAMLAGIGIVLVTAEALMPGFVIIWFGIGFVLTSVISTFIVFSDGVYQLALVSVIGVVGIVFLRGVVKSSLDKTTPKSNDDFLNVEGIGTITKDKMLKYKGTLWKYRSTEQFETDEEVQVLSVEGNVAMVKKLQ
jgi:membrane protein implicated in regulation of membrane protease activity